MHFNFKPPGNPLLNTRYMKHTCLIALFSLVSAAVIAGTDTTIVESDLILHTATGEIYGTLTTPQAVDQIPVALIIAGSGPTDRNGNGPMMQNNSLKFLAKALAEHGIASLRYDKRAIGASKDALKDEADLRFEDYVEDAKAWIDLLKQDKRFTQIIIIGHSEGSLIGMLAAGRANKFVSLAGAGQPADEILKVQLSAQTQDIQDMTFPIIDSLKMGHIVENVNPMLYTLFRPSVQPYLISWFRYDPQVEIGKLTIPVLIVQGTTDIQVSADDARRLAAANPDAQLVLIEGMNHIFKTASADRQENLATYGNPVMPISTELVAEISGFVLALR